MFHQLSKPPMSGGRKLASRFRVEKLQGKPVDPEDQDALESHAWAGNRHLFGHT
jgi:hypothetical protein